MTPEQLAKPNTEHAHQRALFAAINEYCFTPKGEWPTDVKQRRNAQLKLLFAIPNGGERHAAVASKMKAEGAKAGVWDLFLPVPINTKPLHNEPVEPIYHGLFIEMKQPHRRNHKDGGLSEAQKTFGFAMQEQGYDCHVCYTWQEAFDTLLQYLGAK